MPRPWETIESVETPDGVLALRRRGTSDFLITVDGRILMTSTAHRSEDVLAQKACEAIRGRKGARVMVSGLGMAFTLRAMLDGLGRDARVTVVELNPVVARWCQGPLAVLTNNAVNDPRVRLRVGDVTTAIAETAVASGDAKLDALVLDMYEGPAQAGRQEGDPLYGAEALARSRAALKEDGVFAIWSEKPSAAFERRLGNAGFRVEIDRGGRGTSVHTVYLAHAKPTKRAGDTRTSPAAAKGSPNGSPKGSPKESPKSGPKSGPREGGGKGPPERARGRR